MRIAIVGGGIAGLSAAHALADSQHETSLYERDDRLGGKIQTDHVGGYLCEAGPDSFLISKPGAIELCRELGLQGELIEPQSGTTVFVYAGGRLHALPEGVRLVPTRLGPIFRSTLFTAGQKLRIGADLVLPKGPPDGDVSLGSLVRRRMGQAALDRLVAPLVAGVHAADPDELSVESTFPQLLEAERSGRSLMRQRGGRDSGPMFASLSGGVGRLVDELLKALGPVRVEAGVGVEALTPIKSGWSLSLSSGKQAEADAVVLAVPAYVAADLLKEHLGRAARLLARIEYVSTAVVSLGYRKRDLPPASGRGFVVARDQAASITACTWASSKWAARAPTGRALLRTYLGTAATPVDLDLSDDQLAQTAAQDLRKSMGIVNDPELVHVVRWPLAMPQYKVGHRALISDIKLALQERPGIVLAGAGYEGVGIPDCILQGQAAARAAVGGYY